MPRKARAALAATLTLAMLSLGTAAAPAANALCIPILMQCGGSPTTPTPTPTPTPTSILPTLPTIPPLVTVPLIPTIPSVGTDDGSKPTLTDSLGLTGPPPSNGASPDTVFTLPSAQLGGSSIAFTGIPTVSIVNVKLANGTTTKALKLTADSIAITDFSLNVRNFADHPQALTTSNRMELRGRVEVYLNSFTATLGDGTPVTFGAKTPPPSSDLPPSLLRVNLGLIGVTAGSISFDNTHLTVK